MVKPYQRIVSLVCIACETCECERCNVEDLAKRIIDDVRADAIDDFVQKVKEHQYLLSDVINSRDYGMFTVGIEQIAEELKENFDTVN